MSLFVMEWMTAPLVSLLLLFCCSYNSCESFPIIPSNQRRQKRIPTFVSLQKEQTYYNDFDEFWQLPQEKEEDDDQWKDWLSELKERQEELTKQNKISIEKNIDKEETSIHKNWKDASCTSTIRLALPNDWIRRVAIQYPLAVVGGCSGSLYLADLDSGTVLDVEEEVHDSYEDVELEDQEEAIHNLYGDYDGGGIIGLTFHQDYVYSSGREGGFHVSQLSSSDDSNKDGTTLRLIPQGRHLESTTLITSFATDSQHLWAAGYNGILYGYPHAKTDEEEEEEYRINEDGEIIMGGGVEMIQLDVQSPIIHVSVEEELGLGVCSTLDGKVHLFSLQHGTLIEDWTVFSTWAKQQKQLDYARCVTFVQLNNDSWCVIVGGSRGQLYSRLLSPSTGKFGNVVEKLKPHHAGPVMCMTSPHPNLLVTGAQDGTMRVWDIPTCLYALTGYKVWLGSIVTDGTRLLSDGADNTIVLHDFSNNNNKDNQSSSNLQDDIALEEEDDDYTLD